MLTPSPNAQDFPPWPRSRLDAEGKCLAFKACSHAPSGGGWLQVSEIQPAWLGRELPDEARICARASHHWQHCTVPA